jgi:hypothetical protein
MGSVDSTNYINQSSLVPKRKPCKITSVNTNNNFVTANGMNGLSIVKEEAFVEKSSTNAMYSDCKSYSSSEYSNGVNGDTNDLHQVMSKRMKYDLMNGSEMNANGDGCSGMDSTSTFRIPKLEEHSVSSGFQNSIDINIMLEKESLLANSFHNAQKFSNHIQFHQHHSIGATNSNSLATAQFHLQHLLNQPDLRTLASHRNLGMDTVLNSVGSSDLGNSDSVITDASFDSTFDHSASSQQGTNSNREYFNIPIS